MHGLLSFVENMSFIAVVGIYCYLMIVVFFIIMENRDTSSTLAWILVFLLFPIIGFFIYIYFGRYWKVRNPKKKIRIKKLAQKTDHALSRLRARQDQHIVTLAERGYSSDVLRMLQIAHNNPESLITTNNTVAIYHTGNEKFAALKKDLQEATHHIHMEYFIWRVDPVTREIKDILIQKANSGVEVRIIYDPVGSLFSALFHRKYFREMKKAGVQIMPFFNSLSPLKITTINYLLHRKIVVIDGVIGYTGGMNMGQEYIDGGKRYAMWRDAHVRLSGDAVLALQATFALNWEETIKESLFDAAYFPSVEHKVCGSTMIQIIASEPHSYWQPIKQSLFAMILAAQDHVYIQTPYFIPDVNLLEALKINALAGVDVRIMVTGVPDKRIPYWAAFTYFEELLLAGVKIYHYNAGFMHAKTISIDASVCAIGTTNMDIRSLHLSHESNVVIFDKKIARGMERSFVHDMKVCSRFTIGEYRKITLLAKLRNSLVRLLSPLL